MPSPDKNVSAIIYVDEYKKKKKKNESIAKIMASSAPFHHLPEDLVIENVVTRLPARRLIQLSCVSKYWYNCIFNDKRFAARHFAHQNNKFNLVFDLLNVYKTNSTGPQINSHFFYINQQEKYSGDLFIDYELIKSLHFAMDLELVGYCNGLACVKTIAESGTGEGVVNVVNPVRGEILSLVYCIPTNGIQYLCHGFGFDSSSQQYKVVLIYTTTTTKIDPYNYQEEVEQEFVCMVFTLGTNSWRKIVSSTPPPPPPPPPAASSSSSSSSSSSLAPRRRLVTRAWKNYRRSATLCGSDLFWRVINYQQRRGAGGGDVIVNGDDGGDEMLLSFDIHNEKIQFIRLPTQCITTTTTTTTNHNPCSVVDHHLLEYKGYPCVARSEKILKSGRDHHHRRRHRCDDDPDSICCCLFKVHLYTLKDKVKQVWAEEKTLDTLFRKESSLPPPLSGFFDTTTTTATPPTRIMSFCDQVFLYWFDGECLVYYSFQMNDIKVVKGSPSSNKETQDIFEAKLKGIPPGRRIGGDVNIRCPYMDYQLHAQVENFLSLNTFIPQEKTVHELDNANDFNQFIESRQGTSPAGWMTTGRKIMKYYAFD